MKSNGDQFTMILKVALFSTALITLMSSAIFNAVMANAAQVDKTASDNSTHSSKFERGLYDKTQDLIRSGKSRDYYSVIIFVNDHDPVGTTDLKEKNKEKLVKELQSKHNAKKIYKAQVLDFVVAEVPLQDLDKIASYDFIRLIGDGQREIKLEGSPLHLPSLSPKDLQLVRKDKIQPDMDHGAIIVHARNTNYTGAGIKIAIIDTGVNTGHRDLDGGKVVYSRDMTGLNDTSDCSGHGTVQAGVAAGSGDVNASYAGVAPGASLMNIKVAGGSCIIFGSYIVAGIDDAVANGANVINLSVGTGLNTYDSIALATDEVIEKGVVVVAPVGNVAISGPSGSIPANSVGSPGLGFNVITVGGIDDKDSTNPNNVVIARWLEDHTQWLATARGNTTDGRIKPDVVAPAVKVAAPDLQTGNQSSYYLVNNGTSHAAPFVAGAVAQILQAHPTWTPAQIKAALKYTANKSSYPNLTSEPEDTIGKGVIDVAAAVALNTVTVNANMNLAYGINLSSYIVQDSSGVVKYKLQKETSLSYGISAINWEARPVSSWPWYTLFNKVYPTSIKVGSSSVILTDSNLFSGPRVDLSASGTANSFITYIYNGTKIKLNYFANPTTFGSNPTSAYGSVIFDGSCSTTCTVVEYIDVNLKQSNCTCELDKTRSSATATMPYTSEQHLTSTTFYVRFSTASFPYMVHNATTTQEEWILKTHPPAATPSTHYDSESFDTTNGSDIVIDYQGSTTGSGSGLTLGPIYNLKWS